MKHEFKVGSKVRCVNAEEGSSIVNDGIYTIRESPPHSEKYVHLEEVNKNYNYCPSRFVSYIPTLEDSVKKAKDFVGKSVTWAENSYTVNSIEIYFKDMNNDGACVLVKDHLKDNDYCVAIKSGPHTIPVDLVTALHSIEINNVCEYDTIVFRNHVEVGCQKISKAKVEEIMKAFEKLA